MNVLKGDDVSPHAENEPLNGIKSDEVPCVFRLEILWLAQYLLSVGFYDSARACNPLRVDAQSSAILDEPPDCAGLGTREQKRGAKRSKERIQFFFAQIGMFYPQSLQLFKNAIVP